MKVVRLSIENFRGCKQGILHFGGHTLLVGMNNVGKSTVCEALDLVLGPDRLNRFPPVEEFDFYNGQYLEADGETPKPLRVEAVLVGLASEMSRRCQNHLEFWHHTERRLLDRGEADLIDLADVESCLRLETIGTYDPSEDEFQARTFFSHSPDEPDGLLKPVRKEVRRSLGFLYLRALRTGSRALSLERGSLLDIVLRLVGLKPRLWEHAIQRLKNLDPRIDHGQEDLRPVLEAIEQRLAQYVPVDKRGSATHLFVSQLTREHLRKTISFFLSLASDQQPVPFQEVGTGTLNILVLALLSFIAELKEDNVIFAMEEPEIALPPHTQRRVANYLLTETSQCFVTSHSPYIVERFEPSQIQVLRRSHAAELSAREISLCTLRPKTFRRQSRRGLCEAMLGRGVIVAEGLTEQVCLWATASKMEASNPDSYPLDLSGVTVFSSDGDGAIAAYGEFFRELGLRAYAFLDQKERTEEQSAAIHQSFDHVCETDYRGAEALLVSETPVERQWELLNEVRQEGAGHDYGIPALKPDDGEVRRITLGLLKARKGDGTAGRLIELCAVGELPTTVAQFLSTVYRDFPRPEPIESIGVADGDTEQEARGGSEAAPCR
jgi:putative ATP-dependent endonuclease of OLD family